MEYKNTDVWGLKHAVRSLYNNRFLNGISDSGICRGGERGIGCNNCSMVDKCVHEFDHSFQLGKKDLTGMQRLIRDEKDGFLSIIHVSFDMVMEKLFINGDSRRDETQISTIDTTYLELRNEYMKKKENGFEENGEEQTFEKFVKWIQSLPYAEELILFQ